MHLPGNGCIFRFSLHFEQHSPCNFICFESGHCNTGHAFFRHVRRLLLHEHFRHGSSANATSRPSYTDWPFKRHPNLWIKIWKKKTTNKYKNNSYYRHKRFYPRKYETVLINHEYFFIGTLPQKSEIVGNPRFRYIYIYIYKHIFATDGRHLYHERLSFFKLSYR